MISKEAASINESDGKTIRIIEGAAFVNLPEKRFGGVVESDGLYLAREPDRKKKSLLQEYIKACEKLQTARKAIYYAPKESEIFADAIKHISQYEYRVSYLDEQLTEIERR